MFALISVFDCAAYGSDWITVPSSAWLTDDWCLCWGTGCSVGGEFAGANEPRLGMQTFDTMGRMADGVACFDLVCPRWLGIAVPLCRTPLQGLGGTG